MSSHPLSCADEPVVLRAGALKLIHSIAPYFYEQFVPAGHKVEVNTIDLPRPRDMASDEFNEWRRLLSSQLHSHQGRKAA